MRSAGTGELFGVGIGAADSALAATAWIDDEIYVPVRSGAGSGYRIVHRGLKSGTRVEFLGEDGDWAHIRFGDTEGYIGKQYISRSPTAAIRLEQISGDRKQMESRMTEMRERLSSVEAERDRLSAENEELKGSLSSRSDELENLRDVAADAERHSQPLVVVFFGNPYAATFLPELPSVLLTYDYRDLAEESAVRALAGEIAVSGRLPIALGDEFPVGHGLTRPVLGGAP